MNNVIIIFGEQGVGKTTLGLALQMKCPKYDLQDECTPKVLELMIQHCRDHPDEKWILITSVETMRPFFESTKGFTLIKLYHPKS